MIGTSRTVSRSQRPSDSGSNTTCAGRRSTGPSRSDVSDQSGRRPPARAGIDPAVGTERAPAVEPVLGMLLREVDDGVERTRQHEGVGIQQQHGIPGGRGDPAIHAAREAEVLARVDHDGRRAGGTDRLEASVARAVVDDDDLDGHGRGVLADRLEAGQRLLLRVEAHDDDAERARHAGTPTCSSGAPSAPCTSAGSADAPSGRRPMTRAGTPPAMQFAGRSFVTIAPAPTTAPSPIVTPADHDDVRAEPDVAADHDVALDLRLVHDRDALGDAVVRGGDGDVRREQALLAEGDPPGGVAGPDHRVLADVRSGTDA